MHIYKSISHLSYPCSHYILSNITWRSYPSVARDVWPALGPGAVRLERAALELRLWLRVEQPSLEPGAVRLERVALGLRLWLGVELPSVEPGAVRLERVALGLRLHVASGGAAVCGTWWGSVGTGGLGTCPVSLWWVSLRTACCGTGSGGSPYIRTSKTIAVAWFRLERPVLEPSGIRLERPALELRGKRLAVKGAVLHLEQPAGSCSVFRPRLSAGLPGTGILRTEGPTSTARAVCVFCCFRLSRRAIISSAA